MTTRNNIARFLNDVLPEFNGQGPSGLSAAWVPPVDILEQADGIRIIAEVPGVNPSDVKIAVEDNVLTIQGAKAQVAEEKTERVHRYERTYGAFARSFTLPPTVDTSSIKAAYENGVLTITMSKVEKAKPRQIQVEVAKS